MRRLRTESTRPRNRAVPRTASPNRRVPLRASKADARGRSAIAALGNASVTPVAGVTPSGCGDACSGRRTRRTRTASRRTRRGRCDGPPDPGCDYWEPDEQPGACHSGEYFPWRCARRTNLERASRPGSSHHTCVLAGCRCWSRVKRSRLSVPVAGSQLSDSGRAPTGHWRRVRCSFPGEAIARRRRGLRVLGRQGDRQLGDPLDERSCARCARRVAPPQWGFRRWASTRPFPDRTARLLSSLLVATRTGLTPAGDDELMLVSATRYPLQIWAHSRSGLACGRRFQPAGAGLGEVLEPLRSLGGADGYMEE